jgi:hypothetical protein
MTNFEELEINRSNFEELEIRILNPIISFTTGHFLPLEKLMKVIRN